MANDPVNFMKDVLAAPLGELISSIGNGVGEAQAALDAGSLATFLEIYSESGEEGIKTLRAMGYQPTWYAIPEADCEATISITLSGQQTSSGGGGAVSPIGSQAKTRVYATPVNASVSNRYNFNSEASARLKFKVVAVPTPGDVSDMRVVPDLDGKVLADIIEALTELDLDYTFKSGVEPGASETLVGQVPAAGSLIKVDESVELEF